VAELERKVTSMIDQRNVRAAEQSIAARKATLGAQWLALRTRMRAASIASEEFLRSTLERAAPDAGAEDVRVEP